MSIGTLEQHLEITDGIAGGKPRIAGRRITVQDIVIWHERLGHSADEIASDYDLSLAEIHAALSYYFDHRAEVDQDIIQGQALAEALRAVTPSRVARKPRARASDAVQH